MLREQSISDRVVSLADDYAAAFIASMIHCPTEKAARAALAGAFLSFLGDVFALADDE